jgi:diaminopimelate epimerase
MHGAGNDFILFDDRDGRFPDTDHAWIHQIARPKYGIGCEGVILIQPSEEADFRMRFYNPDGNEVEMCGNGARCVARLAHELGAAPDRMQFDTMAGVLGAEVLGVDQIRLTMTEPKDWALNQILTLPEGPRTYHFVNSGVPHVVMETEDLSGVDLCPLGAAVRYHEDFKPNGTNVNVIQITGPDALSVRTYERGVENETLACGTGMVACGLIAGTLGRVSRPVQITCASGDVLQVDYEPTENGARNVTLTGPAVHVFQGEIPLP